MSERGVSRREFLGSAAVVAAAAAVPVAANVTAAAAAPSVTFPQTTPSWTPLDPLRAARESLEIYRGKHVGSG